MIFIEGIVFKNMLSKVWSYSGVRFVTVGVANTIIDFTILNLLVFAFDLNKILANTISVSIAMLVSYGLNHKVVFRYKGKDHAKKLVIFIAITAFGLFVLQNLIIYVLMHLFTWPGNTATSVVHALVLTSFNKEFITLNFAKVVATAVTMVWNYFMYKKFVFNNKGQIIKKTPEKQAS
jgi:putative flippase GtrA